MKDLYHQLQVKQLYAITDTTAAAAYSYYIDTAGLDAVGFLVVAYMVTADTSNNDYVPKLYGYTGDTPGTFTNYTACATAEVNGSDSTTYAWLDELDATGAWTTFISLAQHLYRYYCVYLDETGTAQGHIGVYAVCSSTSQPSSGVTLTTGAVT